MKFAIASILYVVFMMLMSCESDTNPPAPAETTDEAAIDEAVPAGQPDIPGVPTEYQGVKYLIPAGSHYATLSVYQPLHVSQIKFKARFDSSGVYRTVNKQNQGDLNKLYGMSDCASHHHVNSARFAWRWFENALQIWAYVYKDQVRNYAYIDSVPLNSTNTYEIIFTDNQYVFKLNDISVTLPRKCTAQATGYKLYPYFGGDETAPHDIVIWIEDIL